MLVRCQGVVRVCPALQEPCTRATKARTFLRGMTMKRIRVFVSRDGSSSRRSIITATVALAGICALSVVGTQGVSQAVAGAITPPTPTGFVSPFSGTPQYEQYAPVQVSSPAQLNRPIGQSAANAIAKQLGLDPSKSFTKKQFLLFITGRGVYGNVANAKMIDESVRILTNTTGNPLYSNVNGKLTRTVLGSYGLMVNPQGLLESDANASTPTRQVNALFAPGGYLSTWAKANGAASSLVALYRSAYTSEAAFSIASQQISTVAELVTNTKSGVSTQVGMAMVPALWLVNFALIYTLNPSLVAGMPANWAPIPSAVADALEASPSGQVSYSQYVSYFR